MGIGGGGVSFKEGKVCGLKEFIKQGVKPTLLLYDGWVVYN